MEDCKKAEWLRLEEGGLTSMTTGRMTASRLRLRTSWRTCKVQGRSVQRGGSKG